MRRLPAVLVAGGAVALLAGCGTSAGGSAPSWGPSPPLNAQPPGARATPIEPVPSLPGSGRGASGPSGSTVPGTSSPSSTGDPLVVATHLTAPVGVTILPDNTALVGERTTGRIVRVQPRPGQPVQTVRTLSGVDAAGDGGLLDLALSPTYSEDGLIYAYITTARDNRVVDFTLHGPVTPVLTGVPKGRTGNTGRIAFGTDNDLYVGTGDAGQPALAADPHSLAGKVLRLNDIGDPATGNPGHSPVFTSGHHVVDGLCALPQLPTVLEVEAGAAGRADDVNALAVGAGYGWPKRTSGSRPPAATLPAGYRGPGGCAILDGRLWITSLDGRALLSAPLRPTAGGVAVGTFGHGLVNRYGRLKTVVAADDGALWLTTSNRDGHGHPVATDERVIRYLPAAGGGAHSPV